jgi:aryl-alcohol dehydrogenase-like predicted oxidoreductase
MVKDFARRATKPQHLEDAVASLELQLSDDEVAQLEGPYVPHPTRGF